MLGDVVPETHRPLPAIVAQCFVAVQLLAQATTGEAAVRDSHTHCFETIEMFEKACSLDPVWAWGRPGQIGFVIDGSTPMTFVQRRLGPEAGARWRRHIDSNHVLLRWVDLYLPPRATDPLEKPDWIFALSPLRSQPIVSERERRVVKDDRRSIDRDAAQPHSPQRIRNRRISIEGSVFV